MTKREGRSEPIDLKAPLSSDVDYLLVELESEVVYIRWVSRLGPAEL